MHPTIQFPDRPSANIQLDGICIAAIYGFTARGHMQKNLLRYIRQLGYANTTLYGHRQANLMANDLQAASAAGQKIVIIGFSQGGLEAARVANALNRRSVTIDLLVTIAAGGAGRLWPHRWKDDPHSIPANVGRCLNYFSLAESLGTDKCFTKNLAHADDPAQPVENIIFDRADGVSHLAISRCYPPNKVHPQVKTKLLQRLKTELSALQ